MNKKEQRLIIAENLRILLKQNNKKRTDVASDLKISYSTVSDWARGRTAPNAGQVKMLADYFKVPDTFPSKEQWYATNAYIRRLNNGD